ncbi:MAG: carboxy-S-adenosyl-L-methionine synthase CmoA [Deltaproteobacteria bacterium]|nr:carboxy-S-adenosyl-L-methionine synthase CmoA [Deltaproteobacteria bacterium]
MPRDTLFSVEKTPQPPFEFNDQVAGVFDDMIERSVPLYRELLRRQAALASRFYREGSRIYDLGCSNGNFGLALLEAMDGRSFEMVAVDSSAPMIEAFRKRLVPLAGADRIGLRTADIREVPLREASVAVLNLTLQFLPLGERDGLVERIHAALRPGGALLMTEKVIHADEGLSELQREFYYAFKRENGYSELEISRKREALENVLIPETAERHLERLRQAGFRKIELWLKWFNFASFLAVKG